MAAGRYDILKAGLDIGVTTGAIVGATMYFFPTASVSVPVVAFGCLTARVTSPLRKLMFG